MIKKTHLREPIYFVRGLAAASTVVSFLLITVVPYLQGLTKFVPRTAFEWIALIAVIWTAEFTAENLYEMRRTRLAEFEPLLDVEVGFVRRNGQEFVGVHVTNLGKGAAVGLEGQVWTPDSDRLEWFPEDVKGLAAGLPPGGDSSGEVPSREWSIFWDRDAPAHLEVVISWRDAMGTHQRTFTYREEGQTFHPVRVAVDHRSRSKERALNERLTALADEFKGPSPPTLRGHSSAHGTMVVISDTAGAVHLHKDAHLSLECIIEDAREVLTRRVTKRFGESPSTVPLENSVEDGEQHD